MGINRKIFLILLGFYAVFGVGAIGGMALLILPQFVQLEQQRAREAIEGCAHALEREVTALDTVLTTWRYWDDMREYAVGAKPEFADGNLNPADLETTGADLMVVLDKNHAPLRVLASNRTEPETRTLEILRKELIALSRQLDTSAGPDTELTGIHGTDDRPALVALGMITNSKGEASPGGILIMARLISDEMIARIGHEMSVPLEAEFFPRVEGKDGPPRVELPVIEELGAGSLRASLGVHGMRGQEVLRLSTVLPRSIRQGAVGTLFTAGTVYLAGGIIGMFLLFGALDSLVIRRLRRLATEVHRIGAANREEAAVTEEGVDLIAQTAHAINALIRRLNASDVLVRKNEQQFRMLTQLAPVGIYLSDADNNCIFVNEHWTAITGVAAGKALGEGWQAMLHPEDRERVMGQRGDAARDHKPLNMECRVVRPDGEVRWIKAARHPLMDEVGTVTGFLGTIADITNTKNRELELERKVLHDELTGIANRLLFHDRLGHAFEAARRRPPHPFAIFMMDLDGFKAVNDTHGHAAGDFVLREVAIRISRIMRPADTLARMGGDEFALILRDATEVRHCHAVADRILAAVQQPMEYADGTMTVGISIGAALDHANYESANDLVNAADKAMYKAKLAGKNTVFFATPPTRIDAKSKGT